MLFFTSFHARINSMIFVCHFSFPFSFFRFSSVLLLLLLSFGILSPRDRWILIEVAIACRFDKMLSAKSFSFASFTATTHRLNCSQVEFKSFSERFEIDNYHQAQTSSPLSASSPLNQMRQRASLCQFNGFRCAVFSLAEDKKRSRRW